MLTTDSHLIRQNKPKYFRESVDHTLDQQFAYMIRRIRDSQQTVISTRHYADDWLAFDETVKKYCCKSVDRTLDQHKRFVASGIVSNWSAPVTVLTTGLGVEGGWTAFGVRSSVDGAVRVVVELQVGRDGRWQLGRAPAQRRDAVPAPHLLLGWFAAVAWSNTRITLTRR